MRSRFLTLLRWLPPSAKAFVHPRQSDKPDRQHDQGNDDKPPERLGKQTHGFISFSVARARRVFSILFFFP
jgi:hypothetical protein